MDVPDLPLSSFERIVFFTGAGLSSEAGIPTYRGAGGIWNDYDWRKFACQDAFDADPDGVWDFHDVRREAVGAVEPTEAHHIIARIAEQRAGVSVVTQNIDGLHQRAGSRDVIELHGSLWRVRCACADSPLPNADTPLRSRQCPDCGTWRRPDIIWFGDAMDTRRVYEAIMALKGTDLLVSIGTSAVVHPAAELPARARDAGAVLVEINPEETPVSGWYEHRLRSGASETLRALWPDFA